MQLTPHLQRLYSSTATVEHMTWHATHQMEEGSICYSYDEVAWKHFDMTYPNFAEEPRNVRLGLYTDDLCAQATYNPAFEMLLTFPSDYGSEPQVDEEKHLFGSSILSNRFDLTQP
ncbi:UNVERIFIED_CONTAM: hypothetical protein Scaly_0472900 [Sesamum calycinum]|uniref:Uncharacterized protein n=1 Tax=Sesamum calycinum TaxID=2727403 RepID=A0AAW2SHH9_9LAMI